MNIRTREYPNRETLPARAEAYGREIQPARIPVVLGQGTSSANFSTLLRRHRGWIAALVLVFLAGAALFSALQSRLYRSKTVLQVEAYNPQFLNSQELDATTPRNDSFIQTQTKLIKTESLAARVVEKTNLASRSEFFEQSPLSARLREALHRPQQNLPADKTRTAQLLLSRIAVKPEADSDLLDITVDSPDPQLSTLLANQIAAEYINREQEQRWDEASRMGKWLTGQLEDLRNRLQKSENELQRYAQSADLLFTDNNQNNVADEKLRQIQQEYSKAQAERADKQSQVEMISAAPPEVLPRVLDDTAVRELGTRLSELKRQYSEQGATLTPAHYKMKRIQEQIDEVEKQLAHQQGTVVSRVRNEYNTALKREKLLQSNYNRQASVLSSQNVRAVHYNVLKREVDTNRDLYSSMLQKVKEASMLSAVRTNSIRVVDSAKTPGESYRPDYVLNFGLAFLLAAMGSVLLVVLRERSNSSIREPGEVSHLRLRQLGVVPAAASDPHAHRLFRIGNSQGRMRELSPPKPHNGRSANGLAEGASGTGVVDPRVITWTNARSVMAEAYRSVAISLTRSSGQGRTPKVIAFTSPHQKSGKSTTASNLAVAMAGEDRKILLIDCDVRRPQIHHMFGLSAGPGLSDILLPQGPLPSGFGAVRFTAIAGLHVITAGSNRAIDPAVLASERMGALIAQLRSEFDIILLDTPPMLLLPDARHIAQHTDGVVLVVRAGHTDRADIAEASQRLEDDQVPVLGAILNDWDPRIGTPSYFQSFYAAYGTK